VATRIGIILIILLAPIVAAPVALAEDTPLDYIRKCSQVVDGRAEVIEFEANMLNGTPVRLAGLLAKPSGAGPYPGVVLLPGGRGLRVPNCYSSILPTFLEWGYAILTVAPRTAREMDGTPRYTYSFADNGNYGFGAAGALAAFEFVDKDNLVLFGHSYGGSAVVDAVIYGGDKLKVYRAAVAAAPYCPGKARPPGLPLLVVTGEKDPEVEPVLCKDYAKQLEGTAEFEFLLLPETGHTYWAHFERDYKFNPETAKMAQQRVKAFLAKYQKARR